MEEATESQHFENLNQDKQATLGFDPQNPSQNPQNTDKYDDDDVIAVQIIGEELQNLVLSQAFGEERSRGDCQEYETDATENVYGDDHYEHRWSENGNERENDVENEVGWKEGGFNANRMQLNYPLRPDAADCAYYMKAGICKYGSFCKFNHPSRRQYHQGAWEKGKQREESEERAGQIECKYYLTAGGCKYGNACKFNHSRGKGAISSVVEFNFLGLPIRLGEKECPYYMRTGSCKYGSSCRFHHPDPSTVQGRDPSSGYNNGGSNPLQTASYTTWSSPRSNGTAPFVPMLYPESQGLSPPSPQWSGFKGPVYPTSEKGGVPTPAFTMRDPATKTNLYPRPQQPWLVEEYPEQPWLVEEYPERPGQPDCSYFIKTGDCKYKSNCRFNHPKTQISNTNSSFLSDKGLPLRPGQAVCSFYGRYGICKFGPGCKFDHPENYVGSASSTVFDQHRIGNSATTNGSRW